jgi:hypothetical protein
MGTFSSISVTAILKPNDNLLRVISLLLSLRFHNGNRAGNTAPPLAGPCRRAIGQYPCSNLSCLLNWA